VAKAIGTHPRNTRVFLDGLVAIDLLQKKDCLYRNSPAARAFLVESSPTYFGGGLQIIHSWCWLENLTELVKGGPPPPTETSPFSEEMIARHAAMYASGELAVDAPLMVEIASKLPEFPSIRKMLDLGGGPGLIGIAIVAAHPSMKGVIFDLLPMTKIADAFIKKYEMEDRMEVLGGDFYHDSIGEGYDLILACSSMQGDKDKLDSVVQKVSTGMKSNLLILDEPTDGFSKEQLYKVRDILNELKCPQVILVSHERELESFADHIYRIVKTNGSSQVTI